MGNLCRKFFFSARPGVMARVITGDIPPIILAEQASGVYLENESDLTTVAAVIPGEPSQPVRTVTCPL